MSHDLVIAIAAPIAAALFAGLGWLVNSAVTARAERTRARAATADIVRELLNAAMEYNLAITMWRSTYGRPLMRFNQTLFSLLQFGAAYREERPWSGLIQAVESSISWRGKSEAMEDAILTGPVQRVITGASNLLTLTADPNTRSACFALLEAIDATSAAYAGKNSNAEKRKAADEQFASALQLLAETASAKPSRSWRILPRRSRELARSSSDAGAGSVTGSPAK